MKLKIKNIEKIKECNIKLDGITVIAGENSSGKSTIGKTLYTVYHTFYNVPEKIFQQREMAIKRAFWDAGDYPFFLEGNTMREFMEKLSGKSEEAIEKYIDGELEELPFATGDDVGIATDYAIGRNRYVARGLGVVIVPADKAVALFGCSADSGG